MAFLWAGFKPTDHVVFVFGVPLAFLSFAEVSTVCLDSLAILTQLKFDPRHSWVHFNSITARAKRRLILSTQC
jgi:hypothetical protein